MRFEVKVVMRMEHTLAIEADSLIEAQGKAMAQVVDRDAERADMEISVERGNG